MLNNGSQPRATASPNNDIGKKRFHIYKNAHDHINKSIENGYYLEAITLIESLIADRLESRYSYLSQTDFSFKPLGKLITKAKEVETDEDLKILIITELDNWRKDRNTALHQMAKLAENDEADWNKRVDNLSIIAETGYALLKKIKSHCQKLRK